VEGHEVRAHHGADDADDGGEVKKYLTIAVVAASVAGAAALLRAQAPPAALVPVVVELFTSEGCSSCPPADDVLTRLMGTQPVPGVRIIALGEHVDYWDRKGWRDVFSQALFSRRQSDYAATGMHGGDIYTPEFVVNGQQDLVGSDYPAAVAAIAAAAKAGGRVQVSLSLDTPGAAQPTARIRVDAPAGASFKKSEVWLALVENGLTTRVAKGENGGRTLQHTAVVRTMQNLGAISAGSATWSGSAAVALAGDWKRSALHLVAFVQDRSNRHVLGAADAPCN
jgi:hypothetical protein